jgi:3-oxoacyl-[acyl-carrier protein] reductase
MDFGLKDRSALVFGGSRGLGRAAASCLAREGVRVTIAARTPEVLVRAAAEIAAATATAVDWVAADITRAEGRRAALVRCPRPDILVNNADGPPPGDFRNCSRDDWIKALDAMAIGPILMTRDVVDGMIARGFGRIINVSSRSVKAPNAELPLSNGARTALVGFVGGLARQIARHNVTINNLLPGIFDTDAQRVHVDGMLEMTGMTFDALWEQRARGNPTGRYGRAEEFGAYCAFLCSNHAGFITAQNLLIDGGSYPGTL